METQYGIAVKNKFELFIDDDEDPLEILRQSEEASLAKKKEEPVKNVKDKKSAAKKGKKNNSAVVIEPPKTNKVNDKNIIKKDQREDKNRNRPKSTPIEREERKPFKEGNREVPPRRERQGFSDKPQTTSEFRERGEFGEGRGRGRGRGRGFGPRGGAGSARGGGRGGFGRREYDRHSGSDKTSGVKAVDKREGGGAHNWGTVKDDLESQLNDTNTSEEPQDWAAQTDETENQDPNKSTDSGNAEEAEPVPEEEEAKEMTLDEYKAMQASARTKHDFNIRKAGEGCDDSQWKKTYALEKKTQAEGSDEEEEDSDDEYEYEDRHRKNMLNIEITFNDQTRRGGGGGGRGGRGGRGGGRGRGSPRGGGGAGGERGGPREERSERGGFGGDRGERRGFGGSRGGGGFGRPRGGGRSEPGSKRDATSLALEDENDFPSLSKS